MYIFLAIISAWIILAIIMGKDDDGADKDWIDDVHQMD